ncbi:MAG: permease [Candidatus Omnitrophota bacterium]|nr:permease [Candidatus Omnitrophota bacterium]
MSDRRDPICGMTGTIERHGRWFCSERCIAEYQAQLKSPDQEACEMPRRRHRLLDPWVWVPVSGAVLVLVGGWWPDAEPVSTVYVEYLRKVGVPFLIGLLFGGFIDHFVPKAYIVKLLTGQRKRVIARSTLFGFLASSCSHGCLALTIELYRKGASVPAVVSFLLASPWASLSLTFILLSLFGVKGLTIIIGALIIAFVTGLIFQRLARRGLIESNPNTSVVETGFSIRRDIAERWRQYRWTPAQLAGDLRGVVGGMIPLGRMVLGWVQLGLILSAAFGTLIPHDLFGRFLGPSLVGLLLTLLLAAVIEVCSEGTAPLAFELYRHTGAFGNAFAFLMGGVVTDYTELGALWTNIGRRTVFWLLAVTLPLVIIMGFVLNGLSMGVGTHVWK